MEQKNKGDYMNQEFHSSTLSAEEVLSQAISPEKKQELTERLSKLKATLHQMEAKIAEQNEQKVLSQATSIDKEQVTQELDRRMEILARISSETRYGIGTVLEVNPSQSYHSSMQLMLQNLEKVTAAYGMILDGLIK
jgi:HSP90 family molecular chaperone